MITTMWKKSVCFTTLWKSPTVAAGGFNRFLAAAQKRGFSFSGSSLSREKQINGSTLMRPQLRPGKVDCLKVGPPQRPLFLRKRFLFLG